MYYRKSGVTAHVYILNTRREHWSISYNLTKTIILWTQTNSTIDPSSGDDQTQPNIQCFIHIAPRMVFTPSKSRTPLDAPLHAPQEGRRDRDATPPGSCLYPPDMKCWIKHCQYRRNEQCLTTPTIRVSEVKLWSHSQLRES